MMAAIVCQNIVYVMNKWMLEHLWCCTDWITVENVDTIDPTQLLNVYKTFLFASMNDNIKTLGYSS